MNADGINRHVGVVGRKGSGKSTMAERIITKAPRLLVFDTLWEHDEIPNRINSATKLQSWCEWAWGRKYAAARFLPGRDLEPEFEAVTELVWEYGELLYVVEEIPMLVKPNYVPPALNMLTRAGRHKSASVLWTAQRMHEVARRVTAAADWFVLFSEREPRDLEALADRCGKDVADQVAVLPVHDFLVYDVVRADLSTMGALIADLQSSIFGDRVSAITN